MEKKHNKKRIKNMNDKMYKNNKIHKKNLNNDIICEIMIIK